MNFWIFSYNRGQFLRNCVNSIEQCASNIHYTITVFDDNSDDVETLKYLEAIGRKHRVLTPQSDSNTSKHGGLYGNMQAAFEQCEGIVCFLQDDTQLVRAIEVKDIAHIQNFFTLKSEVGFIQPAFFRGCNEKKDRKLTRYDDSCNMYYVDRFKRAAGAFYSDICIFSAERLREKNWSFADREAKNETNARASFSQMPYLSNPIAAWLPNVPAYRSKSQNWAMRIAHKLNNSGFFPIEILTDDKLDRFLQRDVQLIPYAESFLSAPGNKVTPWIYYPLQNRKWLKKTSHLLELLTRLVR